MHFGVVRARLEEIVHLILTIQSRRTFFRPGRAAPSRTTHLSRKRTSWRMSSYVLDCSVPTPIYRCETFATAARYVFCFLLDLRGIVWARARFRLVGSMILLQHAVSFLHHLMRTSGVVLDVSHHFSRLLWIQSRRLQNIGGKRAATLRRTPRLRVLLGGRSS